MSIDGPEDPQSVPITQPDQASEDPSNAALPDDAAPGETAESDGELSLGLNLEAIAPLLVAVSAIAGAFSGLQPTGNALADFLLSAGFAAFVPWMARTASTTAVLGAAVLALFFSGFQIPAVALAAAALAVAMVPSWKRFDADTTAILAMISGGLTAHAVYALPNIRWVGSASLLAALAVAPILITGFRGLVGGERRSVRLGLIAVATFAVVATALAVGAALLARSTVEVGIEQAEDGIDLLEAGDQAGAVDLLQSAQANFADATGLLSGPLAWPSRFVPIAAQHSRALETASHQGQSLAAAAVKTVTTADVEKIRGSNGAIDLAVVNDVNIELANANGVLRNAQASLRAARSPWLLPLLDDRLASVDDELTDVLGDIDLANHATSVLPGILGAEGLRTYLVLFVQPAEAREYGGFVGAYGLLEAQDGRLTLLESGSIEPDFGTGAALFDNPLDYPEPYFNLSPYIFPQNLTGIADLATIARAAAELAPQWREDPDFTIDGVMTIDPYALAGFMELTGPIVVSGRAEPLDSSNVADYLLREQYLEFDGDERDERQDALRSLAGSAFGELLSIEIPGPERLGAIFGPLARADRLAFVTFTDIENEFLRRVLLDADLPIIGEDIEMLSVFQATGIAGKLDAYGTRSMTYDVTVNPETGETNGELTVTVTNDPPLDAGPYVLGLIDRDGIENDIVPVGHNYTVVTLYTRSDVTDFDSPDGEALVGETLPSLTYDHRTAAIEVAPGETRQVQATLNGTSPAGRYDLLVTSQASAQVSQFSVTVRPTDGWRVVAAEGVQPDGSWQIAGPLEHHQPISVEFARDE